jgi:hypothetical protein
MAVNIRNFEPSLLEGLRLRRFDGAESWSYVDLSTRPQAAVADCLAACPKAVASVDKQTGRPIRSEEGN